MSAEKPRFAVLVGTKGRGSNMAALVSAALSGFVDAIPALVISPSAEAGAVERAKALRVPVEIIPKSDQYGSQLLDALAEHGVDIICLAGYMFLLPKEVTDAYRDRVINVHPALLPKFGGKGMYGIHVHRAVLDAGEKESGVTVHFVNDKYDEGEIILQKKCPVYPKDTPEELASRVLDLEHEAYPEALQIIAARVASEKE